MSIRKRLFLSNAAMIIMPVFIIIIIAFLLNTILGVGFSYHGKPSGKSQPDNANTELFHNLKKTASLEPEKFYNQQYLASISQQLSSKDAGIIIRKQNKILYGAKHFPNLKNNDLPSFGNEGYRPVAWIGHNQYAIQQYDFYFKDGSEGTIVLLNSSGSFANFARTFFPILFISLLIVLIITNVLLSYYVSRSILKPVNKLSAAAANIKKGNFSFHLASKGKDELSQLVRSFDDMRAQLKESQELRERYERNRKELIANISHDLKTPITSILGYVEGIQDGVANTKEKHNQYLETIHGKATYMNRLIEELALYSKLDAKRLPFHFETVDMYAFVKDYLEEIEDELAEKGVQLSLATNDLHAKVRIDRDKLIRVLENIIYNSVKYMDEPSCRITISFINQGKFVEVMVSDNGPGVAKEELKQIFNRFYRTDPSRNTGGSGLGLAIANQIIEAHGGSIWAENLPDGGLSIHFTLKKSEDDTYE